ncbi:NUDIX domain-containing protein [bacterium]|nr:NUDIX domain-containing protein [bacterium]MBU1883285.1 NUDIX domain-containing protein [bacterium]
MNFKQTDLTFFTCKEDRYDGVTIEGDIEHTVVEFEKALDALFQTLQNKKLLWIKLPIERADLIATLTCKEFVFHHCNERDITLVKKLIEDPVIPTAKNHTLGVGVVVFHENDLLVIKDRIWQTYKLPGGFIDDGENISQAVVREVFEETGVEVEFESVVSLGHFSPAQFGESNLYVISLAKPISTKIDIKDEQEILEARWMNIDEYLNREDVLPYNKAIVKNAFLNEKGLHVCTDTELILKQNIQYELFF